MNDSLLTKIKLNDGSFSSLLDYTDIDPELNLSIPITSCSISFIDNIVFIGYSEINYYPDEINKTNIIFKINILNKDSEDGPDLDINSKIEFFIFTNSTKKTDSTRQISCEPLKIQNDINNYRLLCLYETLFYATDNKKWRYYIFGTSINENFDGFENIMK